MHKKFGRFVLLTIVIFLAAIIGLPTAHGYLHPADAVILLAALVLPLPQALLAAGSAALLADLLKGYPQLAPITLVIKLLMVLAAWGLLHLPTAKKQPSILIAPALLVPAAGYYLAECASLLLQGVGGRAFITATALLRKDLLQAAGSAILLFVLYDLWQGISAGRAELRRKKAEGEQTDE